MTEKEFLKKQLQMQWSLILELLYDVNEMKSELILLKEKKIKTCEGCFAEHRLKKVKK